MARVHKGKRTLRMQAYGYLLRSGVCLGLIAAYLLLFLRGAMEGLSALVHLFPALGFFCLLYYYRKYKRFQAGAAGEADLLRQLRRLPKQYHVFTNFMIVEPDRRDEADFVIVGENGVFVVEGKNHCGKISGEADDGAWRQERLVTGGQVQVKKMRNPVRQTIRHAAGVARLLRSHHISAPVRGLLVFTNPYVVLDVESERLPVLCGSERVGNWILRYQPNSKLDKRMVEGIVSVLLSGS